MHHAKLALVAAIVLALAQSAVAQSSSKIVFVDIDLAAKRSQSIQKVVKDAENDQKKKQDSMDLQVREYRQMQSDLAARRSVLSESELRKEEKKIESLRDELEIQQREIEKGWRRLENDVYKPAVDRVIEAVNAVAKKRGFDLVLRRDVVLFGVEALDITPLVVQELDGAAPTASAPGSPALPPSGGESAQKKRN